MNKKDLLITGTQAAQLIGVSAPTFYRMSKEFDELAPVPSAGAAVVWSLQDVLDWIEDRNEVLTSERAALVRKWVSENGN